MEKEVKRYIKAIDRRLHLPRRIKKDLLSELSSEIYSRLDDGEELKAIFASIGTPQELAKELEANYLDRKKVNRWKLTIYSVIAFCTFAWMIYSIVLIVYPRMIPPVVIGGADGSRSMFLAYKWSVKQIAMGLFAKSIVFVVVVVRMIQMLGASKNKKGV